MKNRMELKVSFVKTFHKPIDKLFTNVYNMSCKNFIKKPKKSLRKYQEREKEQFYEKKSSKITKEMVDELIAMAKKGEFSENNAFVKEYLKQ